MKRKYDVSISFQTKTHSIEEIGDKLHQWLTCGSYTGQFDFSERGEKEPRNVLHHCFLKEDVNVAALADHVKLNIKKTHEFLDEFSDDIVRWRGTSKLGLPWDRLLMLENLKKVDGIALFIGDIVGGVEKEYEEAVKLGIDCILIP